MPMAMARSQRVSHGGTYVTANGDGRPLLSRDYTVKRVDDWWALRVRARINSRSWAPFNLIKGARLARRKARNISRYMNDLQRSQAGCIGVQEWEVILARAPSSRTTFRTAESSFAVLCSERSLGTMPARGRRHREPEPSGTERREAVSLSLAGRSSDIGGGARVSRRRRADRKPASPPWRRLFASARQPGSSRCASSSFSATSSGSSRPRSAVAMDSPPPAQPYVTATKCQLRA